MQLMPQTALRLGVSNPFASDANIDAGSRYLRELLLRYDDDVAKALAAYNAGPRRVEQYRGVPPYRETRAYVARVIRDFNCRKLRESKTVARRLKAAEIAACSPSQAGAPASKPKTSASANKPKSSPSAGLNPPAASRP
jgi:hypothetical protein